jgi:hypothetical protein
VNPKILALPLLFLVLSGCGATSSGWIQPAQAVQLAAEAAPSGVPGVFAVQVQATGTRGDFTYLNSQPDYRDQRNLTIAIAPAAARQLEAELGSHPRVALRGKRILVDGVAERTRIHFFADGKRTEKFYYQTHVRVTDPAQITVQPES